MLCLALRPGGKSAVPGNSDQATFRKTTTFAQTLWRFLNNIRVTFLALMNQILPQAVQACQEQPQKVCLVVIDWSKLKYNKHTSKEDRLRKTQAKGGYDVQLSLLLDGQTGAPIAPVDVVLNTGKKVLTTRPEPVKKKGYPPAHVNQVLPAMEAVKTLKLSERLVYVIDREGSSLGHWREWDPDHTWLVRTDNRRVLTHEESMLITEIAVRLESQKKFKYSKVVDYKGKKLDLWVAEAPVVLDRPAIRRVDDVQTSIPGRALPLRLVLAELRDASGKVIARWQLLTNTPEDWGSTAEVVEWYYYRWRIENVFSLLKKSGWDVEAWQQETGEAILRKLLLALACCVRVWALHRRSDKSAMELKELLMSFSGRQTTKKNPYTIPGLLAGFWIWQSVRNVIDHSDPEAINDLVDEFFTKKQA